MRKNGVQKLRPVRGHMIQLIAIFLFMSGIIPSALTVYGESNPGIPLYNTLKGFHFYNTAQTLPENGMKWHMDVASWQLQSGELSAMTIDPEKTTIAAIVFDGAGKFQMEIPDWVERKQFMRCSGLKSGDAIDVKFSKMVLYNSDPAFFKDLAVNKAVKGTRQAMAADRQGFWLKNGGIDILSRVTSAVMNPGDSYIWAEMKTDQLGWIAFIYDTTKPEEIQIQRVTRKNRSLDIWVSLDKAADRTGDGRPMSDYKNPVDIKHVEVKADLKKITLKKYSKWETTPFKTATFSATLDFTPTVHGDKQQVVVFQLSPIAIVHAVKDEQGKPLPFNRSRTYRVGGELGMKLSDPELRVQLKNALVAGSARKLTVEYDMKMTNFVSGNSWYPSLSDFNDTHTFKLTALYRKNLDFTAVGSEVNTTELADARETVWQIKNPTKIYGFTLGLGYKREPLKLKGIPEVISIGAEEGFTTGNMVKNVAIDIAKSMAFYQWFFKFEFPNRPMYATSIHSDHGQAFEDFIHLSSYTYQAEHKGASELFRAHEVAHQMWGHMVGWKSDRDQWLSESFAEYSALMFIEIALKEKKLFYEALSVYTEMVTGSIKSFLSNFSRPILTMYTTLNKKDRNKVGPVGIGARASTSDVPMAYVLQNYHKGPLVIHMLRMRMRNATGSDKAFRELMSDYLKSYSGKNPSTDDFRKMVEKHTRSNWKWFFNQWIHDNDIPTYTWNYSVGKKQNGKYPVTFKIRQADVPENFVMPVPVRVIFKGNKMRQFNMPVKKREQNFTLNLPMKPKKVVFNPDFSVLARVKQKSF